MAMVTGVRSGAFLDLATKEKGLSKLIDDMRCDPQVGLVEQVFRSNCTAAKVSIVPRDKDNAKLTFLAGVLQDLFDRSLAFGLEAVAYGHQSHEIAWRSGNGTQYPSQVVPLPHDVATPVCKDGKPVRVELAGEDDEKLTLDRHYFWVATVDASAIRPLGRSQLAGGAVESVWRERREVVKQRSKFARKFIVGTAIIHAPETIATEDGQIVDFHERVAQACRDADAGDTLILSNERVIGANGTDGDYKVNAVREGGDCRDASPLISLIDSLDSELLLAAGIPPKTVLEGDAVGSFAMVTQQMMLLMTRVEGILRSICDTFDRDVIQSVSLVNTGFANSFSLDFSPLTQRPDDFANEIVKTCITSPQLSPLILSGAVDLPAMLRAAGIPISEDAAERFAKLAPVAGPVDTVAAGPEPVEPTAVAAPVDPATTAVADTALNCAQIQSLSSIVQLVASNAMPPATGKALIEAGFPMLTPEQVQAIIAPLNGFAPSTASAAMSLGTKRGWSLW
ncbi:hypothetical protein UFOVP1004_22 [uncultured Caudovirales phage]|uniref:Portal protein n=1 Tax=uncultured Caudovirales phage TaxID=2100421 RepID=A0A6J5Q0K4_9CAUD|nr:hypothetical protein UFOVP1004_22 [uncultured Caudovirales phage]